MLFHHESVDHALGITFDILGDDFKVDLAPAQPDDRGLPRGSSFFLFKPGTQVVAFIWIICTVAFDIIVF